MKAGAVWAAAVAAVALAAVALVYASDPPAPPAATAPAQLPVVNILINNALTVRAEVASEPAARERGLSRRKSLPLYGGMLFVFDKPDRACFWMRDTWLPLRVTFLDEAGKVIKSALMKPMDETLHCANNTAQALETRPDLTNRIFAVSVFATTSAPN